jgi:type IV pilus assembly protein PilE
LRLAPSLFFSIINFYYTGFGKREGMPFFHFTFHCLIKRDKMSGKRNNGFTITELVITMAIIGILSAIIIPMYTNHIRRARRSDAKVALEDVRAMEEQFRAENGNYTTDPNNLVSFGWPNDGAGGADVYEPGDYAITLQAHASGFLAQATPRNGTRQFNTDGGAGNGWLAIDADGNKTSGGADDKWR